MRKIALVFFIAFFTNTLFAQVNTMTMGTNFWNIDWISITGENNLFKPDVNWKDPQYENVWNETFLEEIDMYSSLRFMDWVKTNSSDQDTWESRIKPDEAAGYRGIAYEWQIDLSNRVNADIWLPLPHMADDNYVTQLATLVRDNLDPDLKVYVEYSNEVWHFRVQQDWAKKMGHELGFGPEDEFETAMKYQVYRSAEIWKIFKDVFGDQSHRIITVLSGQASNSGVAQMHLDALDNPEYNPMNAVPDAYAIAPYFGGNGLLGETDDIFELLEKDIFKIRWDDKRPARLENVISHYNLVTPRGIELMAYEGGQHIHRGDAHLPNRDPRMYDIYMKYFDAMAPYFTHFVHYVHVGADQPKGNMWGALEYTGQPLEQAHKYRALRDWVYKNRPPYIANVPYTLTLQKPGEIYEFALKGVNDNNQNISQSLMITAVSENPSVIPHPKVHIAGNKAILKIEAPEGGAGVVNVMINIEDDASNTNLNVDDNTFYKIRLYYDFNRK